MNIELHPGQSKVFKDLFIDNDWVDNHYHGVRFPVVCASRGWGKSYFCAVCTVKALWELFELDGSVPNKNVYLVAPTLDQVKEIYYPIFEYQFGIFDLCRRKDRNSGVFEFAGGTQLKFMSFENIERLRGKGSYFVVNDEISSWSTKDAKVAEAWRQIILPTINTRWSEERALEYNSKPGRAITVSTPKGYNFFHTMFNYSLERMDWCSYRFTYRESPYLDIKEIEKERDTMDPVEWASEYEADFKESGLAVFHCFDRDRHAKEKLTTIQDNEDLIIGMDFNVRIMATVVGVLRDQNMEPVAYSDIDKNTAIHWVKEFKGYPDTEAMSKKLVSEFEGHRLLCFPDPTGNASKSSAPVGQTDFSILRSYGIKVIARSSSPPIVDSVKAVNRRLMTANGVTRMYFDPSMKNSIISMERTKWLENDNATLDKSTGEEHFSDAIRYPTEYIWPIVEASRVRRGFGF